MGYNVGLNIVEVDGTGSPAIVGASTSVAAFNIITQRGAPNAPAAVTSFPQFVARYGGYFPGGLGAYLLKGFFDNGGQTAYINRVVSSDALTGALPATVSLQDGGANNTLKLNAGFRGHDDPGTWGSQLYVSVATHAETPVRLLETAPATVTGTALAAAVDMSAFPPLSIAIDGQVAPTVLTFKAADFPGGPALATPAQIRDAINRQTTQLIASLSGTSQLVLTSTAAAAKLSGTFTQLQVTTNNAALGLATMASPTSGTPAARTTTATQLASLDPFAVGDALRISDGTNTAMVKLLTITPQTNTIGWGPAVANIAAFDALKLKVTRVTFNLTIAYGGNDDAHVVETWTALSMEHDSANYAVAVINDPVSGSRYVDATDLHSASAVGANVPMVTAAFTPLTLGRDGTPTSNDFIGDQAAHTGFYAFDASDVQLVTCERTDPAIAIAGLAYCAGRGDCMYVGAVPQGFVAAGQAIAYGQAFQGKKVYGALYGPWIVVSDPVGIGASPLKTLPPVGHVMGVFARVATARGIWKAPAGDEANLLGALDVEYRLSDTDHTALVKQGSVNGVRAVPGSGVIIDASRTLSTDTRWLYVNVRLLFNYVKSSLKTGLRWVRQEPNRDTLWDAIRIQTVTPFLLGLWRQGAFGTGSAAQVFTVICDASNNPPDQVDQGNLTVEIYFYPSRPAETIVIVVGQQPSGASAGES
ncbi:phage tail sheath family protein [Nitrospirillum iridis]|uniref:Phage tail sheath protein FI n=1 Tax=Nitrospirillum iridis TaxID=765888 RepID=A0A7X0AZY7_9PROT|nr:phage tail sheath C-terminal domain-containing protein [Nitrospirillum iridis]MBB6253145.1 phage tail sheath protein FI [Nitrospirillum iridis]